MQPEQRSAGQGDAALAGVRVIDLTRALAGPLCTLILAGLGAEVIKVEDPAGGDLARGNSPYLGANGLTIARSGPQDMSLAILNRARGKLSMTLNLKHQGAREVFCDLVRHADVVVENFSSGTADRLGVGHAVARRVNPAIVYCSISGFGADQNTGVRAMDTIIQALSGVMMASGNPDDPPVRIGVPIADALAPVWATVGILAALARRERTGEGEYVDVSMLGAVTSLVATEDWQAMAELGQSLRTGATLPRLAPFGLYRCADGWVAIVAPQDRLVASLFGAMGRPELVRDRRFATRDARVSHDAELTSEIERWSRARDTKQVVATLTAAGVPVAPVRTPIEAVQDARVVERGETLPVNHPALGPQAHLRTVGVPVRLERSPVRFARPAPRLGEHTAHILRDLLGYSEQRIARLQAEGVI